MLTGFYRETVQKGRRYINISEAIIDVYKTSYEDMTTTRDRVQVLKGRRLLSQKVSDTLGVKLAGGPTLSIYVDIVKNQDALLDMETLNYYDFFMEEPVQIDNRQQYVISFRPRVVLPYALYYGKLYIDRDKLSFTRAEFSLSMDNKVKAVQAILAKKPYGLRFKPQELSFLVTYKDMDGKTYLNYIRNRIRFKCDWKRKLFSTAILCFQRWWQRIGRKIMWRSFPERWLFIRKMLFMIKWMNIGARIFGAPIISLNLRNHWKMQSIS